MRMPRLDPGDRLRHPVVVDGALLEQTGDRGVDGVGVVFAAGEALADLRFGELAPAEHLQRVDVGSAAVEIH